VSFDYRSTPARTPTGIVVGAFVAGIILALACGYWVFAPYLDAGSDQSTPSIPVNTYGVAGCVIGIILILAGFAALIMNSIARRAEETEQNGGRE
jgi:ABC-type Fe3+ transport system permease subunit